MRVVYTEESAGKSRRRRLSVIARSDSDEAIHAFFQLRDGLLRFARNDGARMP
jgi:hypothetical protein